MESKKNFINFQMIKSKILSCGHLKTGNLSVSVSWSMALAHSKLVDLSLEIPDMNCTADLFLDH